MNREPLHPSALVDSRAELAAGVRVGPYSVVGPEVQIGEDTEIGAHAVLEGRVAIGARCRIGHGVILGAPPQDLKYRPGILAGVRIGDSTVIREYATIHHATREGVDTRIGEHCLIMATSHIAHDCVIGDHVIIINGAGLSGHVTVEDRATIGGFSGIHPFGRIGAYAYVGGLSKVVQDVPPFVMVDGVPATARAVNVVGMRRGGIDAHARRQVQHAFRLLYRAGLPPGAAMDRLRAEVGNHPLVAHLVEFIEGSKRGIVAAPDRWGVPDESEREERVL
jgi:UDP-N-acetylglucosamine acyltransferase